MLGSILIRADGSKDIGMGHINRSLIIANYLAKTKGTFCTLIIKSSLSAKTFVKSKIKLNHKLVNINWMPECISFDKEISIILELYQSTSSTLFVMDLLEESRPKKFINSFKKIKCKTMIISDSGIADNSHCDYFVNGNPCLDPNTFEVNDFNIKRFCGIEYFIMSKNHIFHQARHPSKLKKYRLLITIGGTDHNNILFKILTSLDAVRQEHNIQVLVVVSKAAGYLKNLPNILKSRNYDSNLKIDINCLSEVWGKADIAITAGGNTLFERVAAGLPGMTITQLARQSKIAQRFEELELNRHIGFGPDLESDFISSSISNFLSNKEAQINQFINCKKYFKTLSLDNIFLNLNES